MSPAQPVSTDPYQRTRCDGYCITLEAFDGTEFDVFAAGFSGKETDWFRWLRTWNASDRHPLTCQILAVEPWEDAPAPADDLAYVGAYCGDEF